MLTTVLVASVLAVSAQTDYFSEMDQEDDIILGNETDIGEYLDAPCLESCHPNLVHVVCKRETQRCECEPGYPVRLDLYTGCAKPVKLGDQCYYFQPCIFSDPNAECVQIRHNAICQCKPGYHTVTVAKSKRSFCSEDIVVIATDMSTLLGVATGLMVITALICFTLKLFVGTKPRRYANSNIAPSILFDQTGMAGVSVLRGGFTRSSRGVLVPSSRAGAARAAAILLISCHLSPSHGNQIRRGPRMKHLPCGKMKTKGWRLINQITAPSLASVHSSTSSTRSFSARQYEREKENRLLARQRNRERDGNSPSPRSCENLIDDPLPSDSWPKENEEGRECEAFTPDVLERDLEGSMPHIDDPLTMEVDNTVPPLPSPTAYPKPTR